jgi:hypothetical protein
MEADHDVGHLDAGVVDVVLDVDLPAASTEHPDEGIPEDGVPQMADVGGLVGIDARVFDEDATAGRGRGKATAAAKAARSRRRLM